MWIKIITTKKRNEMLAELQDLRGAYKNLHELHTGLYKKYLKEVNSMDDALKEREKEIGELQKKLRKAEHDKADCFKKLKKYKEYEKAGL